MKNERFLNKSFGTKILCLYPFCTAYRRNILRLYSLRVANELRLIIIIINIINNNINEYSYIYS
jgi:hypothetical protein